MFGQKAIARLLRLSQRQHKHRKMIPEYKYQPHVKARYSSNVPAWGDFEMLQRLR